MNHFKHNISTMFGHSPRGYFFKSYFWLFAVGVSLTTLSCGKKNVPSTAGDTNQMAQTSGVTGNQNTNPSADKPKDDQKPADAKKPEDKKPETKDEDPQKNVKCNTEGKYTLTDVKLGSEIMLGTDWKAQITVLSTTNLVVGKNNLSFKLLGKDGQVNTSVKVTVAPPYMPQHGHGSKQAPEVMVNGENYSVSNIDLFMAGIWEFKVTLEVEGVAPVTHSVYVCILN